MEWQTLNEIIPPIHYPKYQCYILHLNNAGMGQILHEKEAVMALVQAAKNEVFQVKIEKNMSGMRDYRILCRKI